MARARLLLWCLPPLLGACASLADLGDERTQAQPDAAAGGSGAVAGGGGTAGTGGTGGSAGTSTGGSAGTSTGGSAGTSTGGTGGSDAGSGGSDAGTGGDAATDACGANLDTDPTNCGACGHDCLGGDCVTGKCQPLQLTTTPHGARALAVGGGNLFWGNIDMSDVYLMPVTGGSPSTWHVGISGPNDSVAAGGYFYFAGKYDKTVHRLPVDGSQAPTVFWAATDSMNSVALDGSEAYFDQVDSVSKSSGSGATSLGTFPVQPRYLAMDATHVYVSTTAGEVHRIPRAGGSSQKLFSAGTSTWAIAVDDTWVYFGTWPTATVVLRGKKDGAGSTQTIAAGQAGTFDMVRGGDYLYWVNQGTNAGTYADGSVMRARVDGATPLAAETLATGQNRPQGVATDGSAVYWVCFGDGLNTATPPGSVWKLAL